MENDQYEESSSVNIRAMVKHREARLKTSGISKKCLWLRTSGMMELEENVAKGQNDIDLVIFTQKAKTRNIKEKKTGGTF